MSPKPRVPKKPADASTRRVAEREKVMAEEGKSRAKRPSKPSSSPKKKKKRADDVVPARFFSGRTIGMFAALFIATAILAPSLRTMLSQQAELTELKEQVQAEKDRHHDLDTQLKRWDDPNYVQQQARERFNMVMPGEHKYMVIDSEPQEADTTAEGEGDEAQTDAWVDNLWNSFTQAAEN